MGAALAAHLIVAYRELARGQLLRLQRPLQAHDTSESSQLHPGTAGSLPCSPQPAQS